MRFLTVVAISTCLISAVRGEEGTATYYDPPYVPSSCFQNQDHGNMIAGASDAIWQNKAACGKSYRVRCIGPANEAPHPCRPQAVVVLMVDYCSACNGTINLSRDAFSQIADLRAGKVRVEYEQM